MGRNAAPSFQPTGLAQRAWDRLAHTFEDDVCDIVTADRAGVIADTLDRLGAGLADRTVVDLGCGIGTFALRFGRRFKAVYGVDFSKAMLRYAAQRCRHLPNAAWIQGDLRTVTRATVPAGDLTVCFNVITWIQAKTRAAMLRRLFHLTNPGGTALIVVPSRESTLRAHRLAGDRRISPRALRRLETHGILVHDGTGQKYFAKQELAECVRQAGFSRCTVRPIWIPWSEEGLSANGSGGPRRALPWDWLAIGHKRPCQERVRRSSR